MPSTRAVVAGLPKGSDRLARCSAGVQARGSRKLPPLSTPPSLCCHRRELSRCACLVRPFQCRHRRGLGLAHPAADHANQHRVIEVRCPPLGRRQSGSHGAALEGTPGPDANARQARHLEECRAWHKGSSPWSCWRSPMQVSNAGRGSSFGRYSVHSRTPVDDRKQRFRETDPHLVWSERFPFHSAASGQTARIAAAQSCQVAQNCRIAVSGDRSTSKCPPPAMTQRGDLRPRKRKSTSAVLTAGSRLKKNSWGVSRVDSLIQKDTWNRDIAGRQHPALTAQLLSAEAIFCRRGTLAWREKQRHQASLPNSLVTGRRNK